MKWPQTNGQTVDIGFGASEGQSCPLCLFDSPALCTINTQQMHFSLSHLSSANICQEVFDTQEGFSAFCFSAAKEWCKKKKKNIQQKI